MSTNPNGTSVVVDGKTFPEAYLRRVRLTPHFPYLTYKKDGVRQKVLWKDFHARVLGLHRSYRDQFKLAAGDVVCIFAQTCPEWLIADFANMGSGLVTVPIYHSNSVEDVAYIIEHCGAKLIIADDEPTCQKLADAFKLNKKSLPVVTLFDEPSAALKENVFRFSAIATATTDPEVDQSFEKSVAKIKPDDMASIVYTSGTTGQPKGAVLLHYNFVAECRAIREILPFYPSDSTLTFLPFAHIFGRVESQLVALAGFTLNFAESINSVAKDIAEVKPTFLVSVPRIYEKIYAKIQSDVAAGPESKQKIFQWAVKTGRDVARAKSERKSPPILTSLQYLVADKLVFSKIREKLGGSIKLTVSGGAPLARELCEFFHACGIKILEGYGLTETTAAITVNYPEDYVFGTVGKPFPSIQLRIAEDGEIQAKGPMIFKEYYRNPEATQECFTPDGWFCTGDIGEITERGHVRITDRKKELIVTSGGKKIAPQKLENLLKGSRFISNCMVYGDKQKYIVALLTMNEPELKRWAKEKGLRGETPTELAQLKEVNDMLEQEVQTVNGNLASFESIKKFSVLPHDFTVESGELTPSLKVKRKIVVKKFQSFIDGMYA